MKYALRIFLLLAAISFFSASPVLAAGVGQTCFAHTECTDGAEDCANAEVGCVCVVPTGASSGVCQRRGGDGATCQASDACLEGFTCRMSGDTGTCRAETTERVTVVECPNEAEPIPLRLGVPIGNVSEVDNLADYVNALYRYGFGIALIAAIVMVVYGGFRYLVGAGVGGVQRGKEIIRDALIGMLLIISAYVILNTLNPATTNFVSKVLPKVACEPLELPSNLADVCESNADCDEGHSCVPTRTVIEPLDEAAIGRSFLEGARAITSDITSLVLNPSLAITNAAGSAGAVYVTEVQREIHLCTDGQAGSPCGSDANCRETGTVCSDGWRLCIRESNNPVGSPCDTDTQCSSARGCHANPAFGGKKVCIGTVQTMTNRAYQSAGYTFPEELRCTSTLDCAGEEGIFVDDEAICTGPAGSPVKACFPRDGDDAEDGSLCFFVSETRIYPSACGGSGSDDYICMVCPPSGDRVWERMTAANNPQRNRIGSCKPAGTSGGCTGRAR